MAWFECDTGIMIEEMQETIDLRIDTNGAMLSGVIVAFSRVL